MENSLLSRRNILILVIVIALISIFSIVWHYEQTIANHQSNIQSLQEQFMLQKHTNEQLIENLGQTQEIWKVTETELQELIVMDWENKYENARDENESLYNKITEQQYQYDIDISRLERAQRFLSAENNSMKESHVRLTEINHELEQNIAGLDSEIKQQKKTIAKLETENKQYKESIASLKKPDETKSVPESAAVQTSTALAAVRENDEFDIYRHVRIQSLSNAMMNQDSVARKNILVSVIPTIPDGVSGEEFLSLVAGMESKDILSAIQLTGKYITRPLDARTITALTGKMNAKDAEAANLIFKAKE